MRVSTLRAVDRWVGMPACAVLTLHRRLVRREPGGGLHRILFVKLAEQGSTVLAVNALQRAIERVGAANVYFLAFEDNRFIVDALGLIPRTNVLTVDARGFVSTARSLAVVLRRLRTLRIDAAINMEFFARSSAILSYLSGAWLRVGLHSYAGEGAYCGDLMTHRLTCNPYLHTSELFRLMVDALDHRADRFPAYPVLPPNISATVPRYEPSPADLAAARALVRTATGMPTVPPLVLMNPNCGDMLPLRRWPSSRYVELARRLLAERPDVWVLLTGSASEQTAAQRLVSDVASPRCASLAGKTTLDQLLALYSLARVLVTNDSGPAHFAALTDIDVVTLFGPETPALFAARTPRDHVLWAGIACSPCVNAFNNRLSRCRDNVCMQRLSVDDVFEATMRAYARRQGAPAEQPR